MKLNFSLLIFMKSKNIIIKNIYDQ